MRKISDQALIQQLQHGNSEAVSQALRYLHRQVYQQVVRFIKRNIGTSNDAEDVFQDGLLSIYKLAKKGALENNKNMEAYLFAICKNLWFQQLRKRKEIVAIDDRILELKVEEVPLFNLMKEEKQQELHRLLQLLGKNCQKILIDFYYHRLRMREIASQMNYSTEQVAKNQKSQCLKKLRQAASNSSIFR